MFAALVSLIVVAAEPPQRMEPLTDEQKEQIQKLVKRTQDEAASLKSRLETCQAELMKLYSEFRLEEAMVAKKQEEVLDLQRRTLANHHQLQVELRKIVGEERFKVLNQRIQRLLNPPPPPDKG